jgi:hypothetical protein
MNKLFKTRCYLIGNMEYEDGQNWRNTVTEELKDLNITFFNPYFKPFLNEIKEDEEARNALDVLRSNGDFTTIHERMKQVRSDDLRLCDLSDWFIAYIKPTVPTFGSVEELVTAVKMKKPIFVVIEGGRRKCPYWIFGMLPPKYLYDSLESCVYMIKGIDSGNIQIDSTRWRLLKEDFR